MLGGVEAGYHSILLDGNMSLISLIIDEVNFVHLIQMVSTRLFYCTVTILPFVISIFWWKDYFQLYKYSISH
jgi:hypothetical protein